MPEHGGENSVLSAPTGTDVSRTFPVATKTIANASSRTKTIPPKPARLTENLGQLSLRMNFLREGGRGANVSIIT